MMAVAVALTMMVGSTEVMAAKKQAKKAKKEQQAVWPDGTPLEAWFKNVAKVHVASSGSKYVITN